MKTIHSKALRLLKAFRKGKRVVESPKGLKAFARKEINELLGDGDLDAQAELLLELLLDPEWVAEAGECEAATCIPFFAAVSELYSELTGRKAASLEMRLVTVHERTFVAVYKVIKGGFEITAVGVPKLRVRHHKERGTYSGLGAAHGAVYATMEYSNPADAFSRLVYLCWAPQRIL